VEEADTMAESERFDEVIIGAGPIGLACAIEAIRRKRRVVVVEKGAFLNTICNFPLGMTFFSTSERLEIGGVPFVSHGPKPTRMEALEYYRRVKDLWKVKIRTYEEVEAVQGARGDFAVRTVKGLYSCRNIILAMGFYDRPNLMGVPGEDLPKVTHYYREPYPYVDQRLVVVGGGNSAVDAALETHRKGARVTLVTRGKRLDDGVKYWIRPDMENRILEGSIKAYFESTVRRIGAEEVVLGTPGGDVTLGNDFVLAMTGYRPDFDFLSRVGVECSSSPVMEPVFNPATYETGVPGVFLAGVICNGMHVGKWLIENSRFHGEGIFDCIVEGERRRT
jgi:thioredoxin reductase (NADPH)